MTPTKHRIVSLSHWLEECTDLYMQLIRNPEGIGFPDKQVPETIVGCVKQPVRICDLERFLFEHTVENIWRSWEVFSDESCLNIVSYAPLFLDIDNVDRNLEDAYNLTRSCLDFLETQAQYQALDRLRVIFSGMKGFHIEARPAEPVDNEFFRTTVLSGLEKAGLQHLDSKNSFQNGVIDPGHDFIRVTGSYYSWKEGTVVKRRKVIQLMPEEFRQLQIQDIVAKSEAT